MLRIFLFVAAAFSFAVPVVAENRAEADRRAVAVVAPRLVRIETIGGHEKVGDQFANEGTASGFLLDAEGYVVTTAFHFLHDPSSILLRLADDSKKVARRICTDRNRMLTLLKIEGVNPALVGTPMDVRGRDTIKPGERCIAVGVALSRDEPNLALGIVSGQDRIWGKAIQTDAAVGPNNYGGPLLDVHGKLLGILTPLSMMSGEIAAGAETYDAGVGMAVPFEDLLAILPMMKKGVDLESAYIGIGFKENRTFIGTPLIDTVQDDSPAAAAGLKKGDLITAVDGKPTAAALHVAMDFRCRYAGETFKLRFRRDGKDDEVSLTAGKPPEEKKK